MRVAVLGLCLLPLAVACTAKSPETPRAAAPDAAKPAPPVAVVTKIRVQDHTPLDRRPAPVPTEELTAMVREALGGAGVLVADKAPPGAWRVSVDLEVIYGVTDGEGIAAQAVAGTAKALWDAEIRMRPPESEEGFYAYLQGVDEAQFAGDAAALPGALRERLKKGLQPVAKSVRARADAFARDVPALVEGLSDADPDVRIASASRLAMLKAPQAVPALAARIVKEQEREVVLRMVGALAEIGDDRATDALIQLADPKDRELLRAVVDALSAMGGRRVTDFLDILSTHDSPEIREMVEDARKRLGGRPMGDAKR
jgi:hypothetical protein